MYAFLDIRIQNMLVTEKTWSLLLGIALLLEKIWWLRRAKAGCCVSFECRNWVQSYSSYGMRDVVVKKNLL